jgi:RecB family exonuclease
VFPQRRTEDPLLPDSDRRILGLREIGDGRDEERLLFQLISDGTKDQLHYSYATGDGFAKVLRPSRFIRAGVVQVSRPASGREAGLEACTTRQLQLLVRAGTRSLFDGYVSSIRDETRAKLASVSPTHLEDFGECPQKFLLKHILGVGEIDDPEHEIQVNHRDKGTLDHSILERFYRGMSSSELTPAEIARLEVLVDETFDVHELDVPAFNRTIRDIERRATKRILREFVIADLSELHAQGLHPHYFEYRFGRPSTRRPDIVPSAPPFEVPAGDVVLRVEGTIDRIDTGAGRFRIVDYKSGKALRHQGLPEKIDRGLRLQLALYAMAVANIFGVPAEQVSGTIKPLVTGDKPKFAFALHEKQERLTETLSLFTASILNGIFPAFPDDDGSCKYCPVNHSCRTRHDSDERAAMRQHSDPRTLLAGGA